jgi:hypothetical protein
MSRRFIRYVASLAAIREHGTDPDFYRGPDFLRLPRTVAEPLRKWCGENLAAVTLGQEGPDDDPIEVYAVSLSRNTELSLLKTMLARVLVDLAAAAATATPVAEEVFARKSNAFFDTMRESAELRDFVLRVEANAIACRRAGTAADPAILIDA